MKIRIYYEDTDCGGIAYHASYIRFCDRARSEIFLSRGHTFCNQAFVVKDLLAHFHQSAKLGDLIEVKTQLKELKKVSLVLNQEIYRGDERLFDAEVRLGFVDVALGKPVVIPLEIREALCKL